MTSFDVRSCQLGSQILLDINFISENDWNVENRNVDLRVILDGSVSPLSYLMLQMRYVGGASLDSPPRGPSLITSRNLRLNCTTVMLASKYEELERKRCKSIRRWVEMFYVALSFLMYGNSLAQKIITTPIHNIDIPVSGGLAAEKWNIPNDISRIFRIPRSKCVIVWCSVSTWKITSTTSRAAAFSSRRVDYTINRHRSYLLAVCKLWLSGNSSTGCRYFSEVWQ